MNTDIRLNTGFYRNLKTLKLQKRLGFAGIISLQKLWLWTAENCPNGILDGVDTECLVLLAEWDGDENEFVDTLLDLKWLGKDQNGCYSLHDWEERNPWASDADSRADKARFSRLAQVAPNAYRELASAGIDRVTKDEYQQILSESQNVQRRKSGETLAKRQRNASETPANAEGNAGETLAPSPDPSPTPKPKPKTAAAVVDRSKGRSRAREGTALAAAAAFETPPDPPSSPPEPETVQELPSLALVQPEPEILPPEPVLATEPPVSSPPDDGHMHLNEAANLYRQCFAGKNHLQVAPMVLAKLGVLISQYSRDEMQSAFEAAATAGANSLAYLEKTLEGKRADAQGQPRGKPRGRQGEAMRNLAAWAKGDWLREEIATGMARLLADGKREGMPSADLIAVTAENYRESLTPYQLTEEERPRVREMFEQCRKQCRNWPQSKELTDFLPRRRMQDVLPEETQRGSPEIHLWDEFLKQKQA